MTNQQSTSTKNQNFTKKIHGWQPSMLNSDLNQPIKLLKLIIKSGHNLAKKDIFGASDPYVRIDLLRKDSSSVIDSVYTKTKKKTLNPKWNEEFIFRVLPLSHKLLIEVFDENRLTRDDFLGKIELSLQNIKNESDYEIPIQRFDLQQRSQKSKVRGHLEIYLGYIDTTNNNVNEEDLESIINSPSIEENEYPDWEIINHHTPANDSNSNNEVLPSGWEECQDTNGRTYFVNHNSRTTQWDRPIDLNIASTNESDFDGTTGSSTTEAMVPTTSQNQQRQFFGRFHIGTSLDRRSSTTTTTTTTTTNTTQSRTPSFEDSNHQLDSTANIPASNTPPPSLPPSLSSSVATATVNNQNVTTTITEQQSHQPNDQSDHLSSSSQSQNIHEENDQPETSTQQSTQSTNDRPSVSQQNANCSADDPLGPLPNGWEKQISDTGRVFFIDHKNKATTWIDPRTGKPSPSNQHNSNRSSLLIKQSSGKQSVVDDLGPLPDGWEERIYRDGRIFFINHNTKTTQWEDPRIDIPSISGPPILFSRHYKKKYEALQNSLTRPNGPSKFEIKVRRNNILEDSFRIINNVSRVDYLKTKLWIEFDSEDVLDYGGPSREWFYLLSKEMFNPYYGLWEYSSTDKYTLQIKPHSGLCNDLHLIYFKFIGRVAGLAIYHGKLLDAFFIRPFYKMMLEKEITLKDMESVDTEYFNSLKYILENDPSELYLNFSVDEKCLDVVEEKELIPNGAQIPVTNENKHEYINKVIDWRFVSRVKPQMNAFLEGFHEIIPKNLIKMFDENELELLMCGIGNVDVKDWKQNTVYKGGYHPNHIVIQWFWRVVLSFNNEMRSRLLQFVTGTSRVPMNGFKELYGSNGPQLFTIENWGKPQNLPRSHTCFNRLDLPSYESYSDLREKLIKAIEGSETYGGVD